MYRFRYIFFKFKIKICQGFYIMLDAYFILMFIFGDLHLKGNFFYSVLHLKGAVEQSQLFRQRRQRRVLQISFL